MADTTTNEPAEQSDVTAPTEDEQATQTPNDPVEPEPDNDSAPSADDGLAQRLDALEQEVNALKAMLDTLGFDDTTPAESEAAESSAQSETPTVEDLFKD